MSFVANQEALAAWRWRNKQCCCRCLVEHIHWKGNAISRIFPSVLTGWRGIYGRKLSRARYQKKSQCGIRACMTACLDKMLQLARFRLRSQRVLGFLCMLATILRAAELFAVMLCSILSHAYHPGSSLIHFRIWSSTQVWFPGCICMC